MQMMQTQNCNCAQQTARQPVRQQAQCRPERRMCEERRPSECSRPEEGMSRERLMKRITLAGFAMTDTNLYLDTHPGDAEAIRYFNEQSRIYNEALGEYSRRFGPLTVAHAHHSDRRWEWINQPWPWE